MDIKKEIEDMIYSWEQEINKPKKMIGCTKNELINLQIHQFKRILQELKDQETSEKAALNISDVSGRLSDMDKVQNHIEDALYQSNAGNTDVCMQLTSNIIQYLKEEGILFINDC